MTKIVNGIPLVTETAYIKPRKRIDLITTPRPLKAKRYNLEKQGQTSARKILKKWNSVKNPKKAYLFNRRIHHGFLGTILWTVGIYYNEPFLKGFGKEITLDDIQDAPHWLDFEKGGVEGEVLSFYLD